MNQGSVVTVVAEMVAQPGKEEDLKRQLLILTVETRKEEGCIQYDLHQSTDNPGRFVFYENWTSAETLDKHSKSAHILAFRAIRDGILAQPGRVLTYYRIA